MFNSCRPHNRKASDIKSLAFLIFGFGLIIQPITYVSAINNIRILPESEQKFIVRSLNSKKKLSAKEKKKLQILKGIAEGLREIKEAKRGGKELPDLQDLIDELKNEG